MPQDRFLDRLPVIVSVGGVGAAGRSSFHHAYRRTVEGALSQSQRDAMWHSLAGLSGHQEPPDASTVEALRSGSLVRRIGEPWFEPTQAPWNRRLRLKATEQPLRFQLSKRDVPAVLPEGWRRTEDSVDGLATFEVSEQAEFLVPDTRDLGVAAAGLAPDGFNPSGLYPSRNHPRGLELVVYGASDAVNALGLDWRGIVEQVPPDAFSTYAGSAMTQLDQNGNGGLLGARYRGRRVSSKQVPLGLGEMAADFANAYVLGSMGQTGHNMGACATFHYNLRLGAQDIREGRSRVAVVGGVEAPLVSDAMDGLATMGALILDSRLREIEGIGEDQTPDYTRACRPFGDNGGFVMGEGSQFVVLMDAALALELGACILGSIGDVFVHADGHKKSISSPGVGNYLTFAKAVASARRVVGDQAVRQGSFVHAHGTGTPQNRTSESHILDLVAEAFEITDWPVAAVKCFVGHTMAAAGGDQLVSTLGTWEHGVMPGIATIDEVSDDVFAERLHLSNQHLERDPRQFDVAFLNAKGFGGNNATAWALSPAKTLELLEDHVGSEPINAWRRKAEATQERAAAYDATASQGDLSVTYLFDHNVRDGHHVTMTKDRLEVEGYPAIEL